MHYSESSPSMISTSDTQHLLNRLNHSDIEGISLVEFLQASFLGLMDGQTADVDVTVAYGTNYYNLHACVAQVATSVPIESLEKMV